MDGEIFHSELAKCKIRTQGDVLGKFLFISQPLPDNAATFWAFLSQTQVFYPAEVFEFHCVKLYVNVQILLSLAATLDRAHRALEPVLSLLQFTWEIPWEKLPSKSPPAQRMQVYSLD